jgi:hypothetical protein
MTDTPVRLRPTALARSLTEALDTVAVDKTMLTARLGGDEVTGATRHQLRQALSTAIYRRWHTGNTADTGEHTADRDAAFEAALYALVPHEWTWRHPVPAASASHVLLDGVRVALPAIGRATGAAPDRLRVPAARPNLSPGFFLVDGSRGTGLKGTPTLRMYLHLADPGSALPIWERVLETLEEREVPYRIKILSRPADYPRRDALVIYLGGAAWSATSAILSAVQPLPGCEPQTSVFVDRLADGIGMAWEPSDHRPGMTGMSFGQHRAFAVASGLLGDDGDGDESTRTATALREANVDPSRPFRNLDSPLLP